jgi:hypothetical protein
MWRRRQGFIVKQLTTILAIPAIGVLMNYMKEQVTLQNRRYTIGFLTVELRHKLKKVSEIEILSAFKFELVKLF